MGQGARCPTRSWISSRVGGPAAAVARVGHDHAPAVAAHGYADQRQPVRAEERVHRVVAACAVQRDVGQQPVLRVRLPIERKPELVAHAAVRAVAADDVPGAHLDLAARGVAQRGVDGVAALGEAQQLDALLDRAAEFLHAGAQQQFGLALREVQHEAVPRAVAWPGPGRAGFAGPAYMRRCRTRWPRSMNASASPMVSSSSSVRAWMPSARLCGAGPSPLSMTRVVDAAGEQLRGERQAGRAGADDEHLAVGVKMCSWSWQQRWTGAARGVV